MATFDAGLIENFSLIFPFLFVVVVSLGIFMKIKLFGGNTVLQGTLSLILGLIILVSPNMIKMLNIALPWFVIVFIFFILIIIALQIFGDWDLSDLLGSKTGLKSTVAIICLIIILSAIFMTYGTHQEQTIEDPDSVDGEIITRPQSTDTFPGTIYNPKILGLILLFGIATITIKILTKK